MERKLLKLPHQFCDSLERKLFKLPHQFCDSLERKLFKLSHQVCDSLVERTFCCYQLCSADRLVLAIFISGGVSPSPPGVPFD